MNLPRRDDHVLGQPTRAGKANLIVARLAEVRQTRAAVPADAAGEDALGNHSVTHGKPAHLLTDGRHFSRPLVTRHERVTIESLRASALVKLDIAAADADRTRPDEDLVRSGRR